MPSKSPTSTGNLHALSKMVSNAGFQRIMFDEDFKLHGYQMKRLLMKSGMVLDRKHTFLEIIEHAYSHLVANYRHEYVYKAALLNSYVLKNYSLEDTILLNEFRIGQSKADAVLVNGTNKVFEIKTELDSPDRLNSQINDYYKAFSEVYIVVHHTHSNKYLHLIEDKVGVMTFNNNSINILRHAVPDNSKLDTMTMMKALRKDEVLNIVKSMSGNIPDVQPIVLFKSCLNILQQYAADEVQSEFLNLIKRRINQSTNKLINTADLPDSLRLSCYYSNLNQNEYLSLVKKLSYQF
jgi:hypothetical protein